MHIITTNAQMRVKILTEPTCGMELHSPYISGFCAQPKKTEGKEEVRELQTLDFWKKIHKRAKEKAN